MRIKYKDILCGKKITNMSIFCLVLYNDDKFISFVLKTAKKVQSECVLGIGILCGTKIPKIYIFRPICTTGIVLGGNINKKSCNRGC